MEATYFMDLKDGSRWQLGENGRVLWDGSRSMGPFSNEWRVIGVSKRAHSAHVIPLATAANGADIGQGWVHDYDHGTHRIWCMPETQRAKRITR